jgi:dihydropteroate synthase
MILNCAGKMLDLSQPQIMGILNITPDSFFSDSRCEDPQIALKRAWKMIEEGAAIIDIGAEATNPQCTSNSLDLNTELKRLLPIVELLARELPIPISVDTSKAPVIRAVLAAGAGMINDVRALRLEGALSAVAAAKVPVCLMHMHFVSGLGGQDPDQVDYKNGVVAAVKEFLQERIHACLQVGIARECILIDPGIGGGSFGKSLAQDLSLLRHLDEIKTLDYPLLVGVSRKSFIGKLLNLPAEERLAASLAATVLAITQGANIIRTHDVKATYEAVRMTRAITLI